MAEEFAPPGNNVPGTGNVAGNMKSGGDVTANVSGSGTSDASTNTSASGLGVGGPTAPLDPSIGLGSGVGSSEAVSGATGAEALAAGGDVTDQTSIGSINING